MEIAKPYPEENDRSQELVVASLVLDAQGNRLDIYECQVIEAERHLTPLFDFVASVGIEVDRISEHLRRAGSTPSFNFATELNVEILDDAFLICEGYIPYESFSSRNFDDKLEPLDRGFKNPGEVVRFSSLQIRPHISHHGIGVQIEVPQGYPVGESDGPHNIINRIVYNPKVERAKIAFLEIDTPKIAVS